MEKEGYRSTLAGILESTGGKHLLTLADVRAYTGFKDNRSLKRRYPFVDGCISAETLANRICGGNAHEVF